jgi:hypothetical protein
MWPFPINLHVLLWGHNPTLRKLNALSKRAVHNLKNALFNGCHNS